MNLKIRYLPIEQVSPYEKNSRTHSKDQIELIKNSIKEFGVVTPLGVRNGVLVYGHARLEAMKQLDYKEIPTVDLSHLSDNQMRAYVIADNQLALRAGWDEKLLAEELHDLKLEDFDLDLLGFDEDFLNGLLEDGEVEAEVVGSGVSDEVPDVGHEPLTVKGDIWKLGKNRLMCGDSTLIDDVEKLMGGEKADLLLTDPPYGVSYSEKNEFLNSYGKSNRVTKPIENDSMSPDEMYDFWKQCLTNAHVVTTEKASYYVASPQGGVLLLLRLLEAIRDSGFQLKHQVIWVKNNHVLGRCDYHYKHEPIIYGWKEGESHHFVGNGEKKTSVWDFPKPLKSDLHPTMKPVALWSEAIKNSAEKDSIVLDLFAGSGTIFMAAEENKVRGYGMEFDPHYCDVSIERWQKATGKKAIHEESGRSYDDLKSERGIE